MKTSEKANNHLLKFGKTLNEQRTVVSKKTPQELAQLLSHFSGIDFTAQKIEQMESGIEDVEIIYWVYVWQYYQNIDNIIKAYDAKEMMFLAQQEFLPSIEKEMIDYHKKENNNENQR